MCFGGRRVDVAMAVVEVDAPLLLGIDAMEGLGIQIEDATRTCVMAGLSPEVLRLEPSPTGHVVVATSHALGRDLVCPQHARRRRQGLD